MKTIKSISSFLALIALISIAVISCKKDEHVQPDVSFKTGTGYTSSNATVNQGDTLLVGIIGDKTEDELKTLNVSVAYDGGSTNTQDNFNLTGSEEEHFEKDYEIITRSQVGTELWVFTVTDRDGNVRSVELTITVN